MHLHVLIALFAPVWLAECHFIVVVVVVTAGATVTAIVMLLLLSLLMVCVHALFSYTCVFDRHTKFDRKTVILCNT